MLKKKNLAFVRLTIHMKKNHDKDKRKKQKKICAVIIMGTEICI